LSFADASCKSLRAKLVRADGRRLFGCRVTHIEVAPGGAPKPPKAILDKGNDVAIGETVGVFRIVPEVANAISVIAFEPIIGPHPQEREIVLHDCSDPAMARIDTQGQMIEAEIRAFGYGQCDRRRVPLSVGDSGSSQHQCNYGDVPHGKGKSNRRPPWVSRYDWNAEAVPARHAGLPKNFDSVQ